MDTGTVLPFRRDAEFYLARAAEYEEKKDPLSRLRYLRLAAETGSREAGIRLAEALSGLRCCQASDRELLRLARSGELPPEGYYLAGINAAGSGRYITARAALEKYLFFCPYTSAAEHAEYLLDTLDSRYQTGKHHISTACICLDRWKESFLAQDDGARVRVPGSTARTLNEVLDMLRKEKGAEAAERIRSLAGRTDLPQLLLQLMLIRAAFLEHDPVTATGAMLCAIPLCSNMADALLFCRTCLQCGRASDGLAFAEAWLKHFPLSAEFLLTAAECCEALPGKTGQALDYRRTALKADPQIESRMLTGEQTALRTFLLRQNRERYAGARKRLLHTCCLVTGGVNGPRILHMIDAMLSRLTPAMLARLDDEDSAWRYAAVLYVLHTSGIGRFSLLRPDDSALPPSLRRKLRQIGKNDQ